MYHQQQHEHQHYQQHQPLQQQPLQHRENGNGITSSNAVGEGPSATASDLDHALLESLFYNEMVMLDPSAGQSAGLPTPTEHDTPHTIVEKEILRDFGVGGTTLFAAPSGADAATPLPPPEPPATVNDIPYNNGHANVPQNTHPAASAGAPAYSTTAMQSLAPMQQQPQQHQPPSNPLHQHHGNLSSTTPQQQYTSNMGATYAVSQTVPTPAAAPPPGAMQAVPQQHPQQQHPQSQSQAQVDMVYMDPQATATAAAAAAAMFSPGGGNGGMKIQTTASIPTAMAAAPKTVAPPAHSSPTAVAEPAVTYSNHFPTAPAQQRQQQQQHHPQHRSTAPPSSSIGNNMHGNTALPTEKGPSVPSGVKVPQERARQLVDQFATLASRLGIDLPDSVLKSLTSAAAKNDPNLLVNQKPPQSEGTAVTNKTPVAPASTVATTAALHPARNLHKAKVTPPSTTTTLPTRSDSSGGDTKIPAMAPTVMELRNMAEEAIAAVTQSNTNRTASTENLSGATSSTSNNNSGGSDNKPTYSKRRKKPRLSDCEDKLAQLKAENEQLKRHLQNVSNKAHKFDREKEEAGKQIARLMHDPNAGPREMEFSVRKFSDMYSDYGINRQQELSFHLEQLQRLVNPTNFTKMGLWTLGQSPQGTKKNPIAGILVKELDITPQQGRKILDQSEKIRQLCDNLKEAHALLVKLKLLCEKKTRCFQDRMNKCTEILTSKQVVKLIIWINENTRLLENVCPGWGTEHIQSKK